MSRRIFKYTLDLKDQQEIETFLGACFLTTQLQHDSIQVWAVVDTEAPRQRWMFSIKGTGGLLENQSLNGYIGTVQKGDFVWHVFAGPESGA